MAVAPAANAVPGAVFEEPDLTRRKVLEQESLSFLEVLLSSPPAFVCVCV